MSTSNGFRSMSELIDDLRRAEEGLRRGDLSLEALDASCGNARELYERLVVLRHKAREARHAKAAPPPPPPTPPQPEAPPAPSIRLDTRPAAPRQTTLEEAIAEQQPPQPAAPPPPAPAAPAKAPAPRPGESVAEKLERSRIADLGKAISLSDKFWFIKELFGGDAKAYEQGIAALNAASDLRSAEQWLQDEALSRLQTKPDPEALEVFHELLERRFA